MKCVGHLASLPPSQPSKETATMVPFPKRGPLDAPRPRGKTSGPIHPPRDRMLRLIWLLLAIAFTIAIGLLANKRGRHGFGCFVLACLIPPLLGLIVLRVLDDLAAAQIETANTPSGLSHVH